MVFFNYMHFKYVLEYFQTRSRIGFAEFEYNEYNNEGMQENEQRGE